MDRIRLVNSTRQLDSGQLYSGMIRLHVLHHAAKEEIFGLGIIEELARHGYKLSPGTLYPILHGLEHEGLLRCYERCLAGKIRRMYRATAVGQRVLMAAKEKVRELFGELFEDETRTHLAGTRRRVAKVQARKLAIAKRC
ncbi:MAG: PadR family transcriptional regulator [Acidobacteriia bacterium]|nr:PadR family transcriptional regulator [Terriglobia bacterium]